MSFGRRSSSASSSSSNYQTTSVDRSYNQYHTMSGVQGDLDMRDSIFAAGNRVSGDVHLSITDEGAIAGMQAISEKSLNLAALSMKNTKETALEFIDALGERDKLLIKSFSDAAGDERDALVNFIEERQQPDLAFVNKMVLIVVGGGVAFMVFSKR